MNIALNAVESPENIVSLAIQPKAKPARRKQRFRVIEFRNHTGSQSWRVDGYKLDGSRVRENYADSKTAQCRQLELEAEALKQPVDRPMSAPAGGYPVDWMDFVPALEVADSDIIITKRQWGAFYGTELDLQLRRRGVRTIVLGGVSTNIGVESTARAAWEHGYGLVFAEDAMSSSGTGVDLHGFSIANILPRLGLVRQTSDILAALD